MLNNPVSCPFWTLGAHCPLLFFSVLVHSRQQFCVLSDLRDHCLILHLQSMLGNKQCFLLSRLILYRKGTWAETRASPVSVGWSMPQNNLFWERQAGTACGCISRGVACLTCLPCESWGLCSGLEVTALISSFLPLVHSLLGLKKKKSQ